MPATYVIDTSVILAEGKKAFYAFGTDDVVIPYKVVEELQSKRGDVDLGYYAREALNEIARLKDTDGDIKEGISLGDSFGTLRVEVNHVSTSGLPAKMQEKPNSDIQILAVAHGLKAEGKNVVLVTRDVTLQILADIADVKSITATSDENNDVDRYIKSVPEHTVSSEDIDKLYTDKVIHLGDLNVPVNTGVLLKSHDGSKSALVVAKSAWSFQLVKKQTIGSIEGKSKEQTIAIDHLMDNSIGVVSLGGRAGSGKSMLALAAGLKLVADSKNTYSKVVVFRPINAVGGAEQELGFLPGTIDEKLAPIMQPVFDTIATFNNPIDTKKIKESGVIEFRSIAHARGSTLTNCVIIVDEVQNLSKSTIGTLLTRAGNNARIFLCWDVNQTDAKYIGKFDGIFRVVRYLLGKKLFAHVSLIKSERSPIAEMASGILEEM